MDLRKSILTKNECYISGKKQKVLGVMWHSTGAKNPKLSRYVPDDGNLGPNRYNNHWNQARPGGRKVCVHAFIGKDKDDKVQTYQTLPFDMQAWGSGSGRNGSANTMGFVQFEICEDDLKDPKYFKEVYDAGVEFTAYLEKTYKFGINKGTVIDHSMGYKMGIASNHGDIMHWFKVYGKTMDDVRRDVEALLAKQNKPAPKPFVVEALDGTIKVTYNGKTGLNVRTSPDYGDNIDVIVNENEVFTVVGIVGDFYKLKSGLYITNSSNFVKFTPPVVEVPKPTAKNIGFKHYLARVKTPVLYIRDGAGSKFKVAGAVKNGEVYTIVAKSGDWGMLKSGAGWIHLGYTEPVK